MDGNQDQIPVTALTITQVVTLKLKEGNYLLWKLQFEQFLSSQMLLGYVTDIQPRPPETTTTRNGDDVTKESNTEFTKWMKKDHLILAWIYGTLTEDALKSVYGLHSSRLPAWTDCQADLSHYYFVTLYCCTRLPCCLLIRNGPCRSRSGRNGCR